LPLSIIKWYESSAPTAEIQDPRTDHYLNLVGGEKMSIKVREGRLEVKKRYSNVEIAKLHPKVRGHLENWRKWGIDLGNIKRLPSSVSTDTWIPVTKRRRLCTFQNSSGRWRPVSFDLASFDSGCEMELTTLKVGSQVWWTLAFEAFGPANGNRAALLSLSAQIFATLDPPDLSTPDSFGYPRWLDLLT
jgi:hypothetical protein